MESVSIVRPEPLELTDSRTVQLLFTAGAAIRVKQKYGIDIESPQQANLDPRDPANFIAVLRIIAACCVRWSPEKRRWVHDPVLTTESDEDLAELVEMNGATVAFKAVRARSNVGLPRMPAPPSSGSESEAAAQATGRIESLLKVNGSAGGHVVESPELDQMNSGT